MLPSPFPDDRGPKRRSYEDIQRESYRRGVAGLPDKTTVLPGPARGRWDSGVRLRAMRPLPQMVGGSDGMYDVDAPAYRRAGMAEPHISETGGSAQRDGGPAPGRCGGGQRLGRRGVR